MWVNLGRMQLRVLLIVMVLLCVVFLLLSLFSLVNAESVREMGLSGFLGEEVGIGGLGAKGDSNGLIGYPKMARGKYVMATNRDFTGTSRTLRYIGKEEYVEIPPVINNVTVVSYSSMFEGTSVKGVKSKSKDVKTMSRMFAYSKAKSLDLSELSTEGVVDMSKMFLGAEAKTLDISGFDMSKVRTMGAPAFEENFGIKNYAGMFSQMNVDKIVLSEDFDTSNVFEMSGLFMGSDIGNLQEVVEKLDTESVTHVSSMFRSTKFDRLDVSALDFSNVIYANSLFAYQQLDKIEGIGSLDLLEANDIGGFFGGTTSERVVLPKLDTSKVKVMSGLFSGADIKQLQEVVDKLDTSSAVRMDYMFYGIPNLTLDVSHFNTSNVDHMNNMFGGSRVRKIDLSNFDTGNVRGMREMFLDSEALDIDVSGFNTERVTDMASMFEGSLVEVLDLSSFDTSEVNLMGGMFRNSKAEEGYAGTQGDAERLNNSVGKPSRLLFKPIFSFSQNGNEEYSAEHSTVVTAGVYNYELNDTKYKWSQFEDISVEGDWDNFASGDSLIYGEVDGVDGVAGDYYLHVTGVSGKSGNTLGASSLAFKIDNKKPSIEITQDFEDFTDGDVVLAVKGRDSYSGVKRVKVVGGDWVIGDTLSLKVTENGEYRFKVEDNAGNIAEKGITVGNIDKTGPELSISNDGGGWAREHTTVVSVEDGGSGLSKVEYQWTDTETYPTSGEFSSTSHGAVLVAPKTTGNHYLHLKATDNVGNVSVLNSSVFKVDRTEPTVTVEVNTLGPTNKDVEVTVKGKDDESGVLYISQSGEDKKHFGESHVFTITENGNYSYSVHDKSGNEGNGVVNISNIYKERPDVSLSDDGGDWAREHSTVLITEDKGSGIGGVGFKWSELSEYSEGGFQSVLSGEELTTPEETGKFYLHVKSVDNAGNVREFTSKEFKVDRLVPDVKVTASSENPTNKDVTITVEVADAHSGVSHIMYGELNEIYEGEVYSHKVSENGTYRYLAYDKVGNQGTGEIKIDNIDKTAPELSISKEGGGWATSHTTVVSAVDEGSGIDVVEYAWSDSSSGFNGVYNKTKDRAELVTPEKSGNHYLHVRATDKAGNSEELVSDKFKVDVDGPDIELENDGGNWQKSHSTKVSVSDGHSSLEKVEYRWTKSTSFPASGLLSVFTGEILKAPKETGNHYLHIRSVDEVGNITKLTSKAFKIDITKPYGKLDLEGEKEIGIDLLLVDSEDRHSGLHGTPYYYELNKNDKGYQKLEGWSRAEVIEEKGLEYSSKYAYRAKIRDEVGNESITNEVVYASVTGVKDPYYEDNDTSTLIFDFTREIDVGDGVEIEVSRSGTLIATIKQGDKFEDKNLDYERGYDYTFTTVVKDSRGGRVESLPLSMSNVMTGSPALELNVEAEHNLTSGKLEVSKPVMSEGALVKGDMFYKQGGAVALSYGEEGKEDNERVYVLRPNRRKFFEIKLVDVKKVDYDLSLRAELVDREVLNEYGEKLHVIEKELEVVKLGKRDLEKGSIRRIY